MDIAGIILSVVGILLTIYFWFARPTWLKELLTGRHGKIEPPPIEDPPSPEPAIPGQIWNVPLPRNPNFTGRVELLEKLHRSLESGAQVALTALHGLGGVGKTQTALEYAYRHRQDYTVVWWVRAEEPARLASDYAALAGELDPVYREVTDQRILKEFVRRWLENNAGWLLVLDNVPTPEDVTEFRPACCSGHLLITSRHEDWRAYGKPLPVPTFDRQSESVVFLLQRTGQTDAQAAAELAQELGDLPLALEHAAAYCCEVGCSLEDYRRLFLQRRTELLAQAKTPPGYDATILTTWNVSFTEAAKTPGAAELLNLCAFLAPDDIPLEIIKAGIEHLPKKLAKVVKDDLKFNQSLAALKRFSLIGKTDDALSLHRLVQTVLRDRMTEAERKTWAAAATEIVNKAFPQKSQDVRTWTVCARLLPHAVIVAEFAENLEVAQKAAGHLWNQSGLYLMGLADFKNAKAHFERALRIDEKTFGPNHPEVATDVNNLGSVLNDLGDLKGAKEHFERALRIDEKAYGTDHPNVARDVNNLGSVLQALGDLKGAKDNFERALRIDEKAFGPDHPNVAIRVNNLGSVLKAQGDLKGAKEHYERALRIDEKAYGPNHPEVATDVNNLGSVLQDLGDLKGAKEHFERALRIYRLHFDENHPNVQLVLRNLAALEK